MHVHYVCPAYSILALSIQHMYPTYSIIQYRSQVTWQVRASSEVASRAGISIARARARGCRTSARARSSARAHARAHVRARSSARVRVRAPRARVHVRRRGPNIAPSAKTWKDRDNTQLVSVREYLVNFSDFVERGDTVEVRTEMHRLLSTWIFVVN